VATGFRQRSCFTAKKHDPEKWQPVFGKDHASPQKSTIPKSGNRLSAKIMLHV
jgi:hypothetical protein